MGEEMKYRVGDKIRCLKVRGDCEYLIGKVFTITSIEYNRFYQEWCILNVDNEEYPGCNFYPNEI